VIKFAEGGIPAVQRWYLHVATSPGAFVIQAGPHWGFVWFNFGVMAVLTVVLWLLCRRMFRTPTSRKE
jgi:hypothetical protein